MKRLTSILLAALICFCFAACGSNDKTTPSEPAIDTELHLQKLTELLCSYDGIWFGKHHGRGFEYEFRFFEDGHYEFDNNNELIWGGGTFYTEEDAVRRLDGYVFQTNPDFDLSKGLYSAQNAFIGYNKDGRVVIYYQDYICYQESLPSGAQYSDFKDHPYLPGIYGTWDFKEYLTLTEYKLYKSITINPNGSCIVDGERRNWRIEDDDSDDNCLYIGIYDGFEMIYAASFEMRKDENSEKRLCLFPVHRPKGAMTQPNYYAVFEYLGK